MLKVIHLAPGTSYHCATNPVMTNHTITATSLPEVEVNFNIENGAECHSRNAFGLGCVTGSDPTGGYTCAFTYPGGDNARRDDIRVWSDIDTASNDVFEPSEPNDYVEKNWIVPDVFERQVTPIFFALRFPHGDEGDP